MSSRLLTPTSLYKSHVVENWPMYFFGFITMFLTSMTEILVPKFIQWALDYISNPSSPKGVPTVLYVGFESPLTNMALGLFSCLFIGMFGRFGWRQTLARQTHKAGYKLQVQFWNSLRLLPMRMFHKYSIGDLMNRATGDWNQARIIHGFTLVLTFDLIFFSILSVVFMFQIDWQLSLLSFALLPVIPRFVSRLAKLEYEQHEHAQENLSKLSDLISQAISTVRLQRAMASERMWTKKLNQGATEYNALKFEVFKTGWKIFPLGVIPSLSAYAVLLSVGVYKIRQGELTIGEFVAMQSYVMLLQIPMYEIGDCISEWQRGFASLKRVIEIFNLPNKHLAEKITPVSLNTKVKEPADDYRICGLNFCYPGSEGLNVLDGVELNIAQGSWIGITGAIGTGKSTLLRALSGLVEVDPKQVYLGGNDVSIISRNWLVERIVKVPQKSFLFAGTLKENLQLDGNFTDEELWAILDLVCLKADVATWDKGLMTVIGEWGINLSGGQKQRLALARALLRGKSIILLDDCLSAVDSITEEKILINLSDKYRDNTIVWVAHRLSTLAACDKIFELDQGKLHELRSH